MKNNKRKLNVTKEPFVTKEYQEILDKEERLALSQMPRYYTFDEYAKNHPEGETFRRWITSDGRRNDILFIPSYKSHSSIPGGYLWSYKITYRYGNEHNWYVNLHDCDDDMLQLVVTTELEADQALKFLDDMAPVYYHELANFGWNRY